MHKKLFQADNVDVPLLYMISIKCFSSEKKHLRHKNKSTEANLLDNFFKTIIGKAGWIG